jgi:transcriptional regulator CtsR
LYVFNDEINVSQFYIYASSDKYLSNQAAVKKIKKDNTESSVRQFINKLKKLINSVMNKGSQILLIKKFLISNEETLLINQVSNELVFFTLVSSNTILISRVLK